MTTLQALKQAKTEAADAVRLDRIEIDRLKQTIDRFSKTRRKYVLELPAYNNVIRFGVASDIHVGSLYERIDALCVFLERCERGGIKTILVPGDILDGHGIYKGQAFEQYAVGLKAQLDAFKKKIPQFKNLVFHFITGNHDESFKKSCGVDIGAALCQDRPNWKFLGESYAELTFQTKSKLPFRVTLAHPGGGSAYSLSYRLQKNIESLSGGTKPDARFEGHFHKAIWLPGYRNVEAFSAGCFDCSANVVTTSGQKRISNISRGDEVLTHLGRFKPVTQVLTRKHSGEWTEVFFGRKTSPASRLSSTSEHPLAVLHEGELAWKLAGDLERDDWLIVEGTKCELCGAQIPYFLNYCTACNPMDTEAIRIKASMNRHGNYGVDRRRLGTSTSEVHLTRDIIPGCETLQREGWKIIPVGGGVVPDAVGFKDGELRLFEFEGLHYSQLAKKQAKYSRAVWLNAFPHQVSWIDTHPKAIQSRSPYLVLPSGFVAVKVEKVTRTNRTKRKVFNLEVAEDHSYVAMHTVVHNCFQSQTPFMQGRGLSAAIGGWEIEATITSKPTLTRSVSARFHSFFEPQEGGVK